MQPPKQPYYLSVSDAAGIPCQGFYQLEIMKMSAFILPAPSTLYRHASLHIDIRFMLLTTSEIRGALDRAPSKPKDGCSVTESDRCDCSHVQDNQS
jgi:hypothetical protein